MSHHGEGPFDPDNKGKEGFERIMRQLKETSSFRGALGVFPAGQLTKTDEGAIQFAVGEKAGKVVLDFGTPVSWIGMTAQEAVDIGAALIKRGQKVGRQNGEMIHITIG